MSSSTDAGVSGVLMEKATTLQQCVFTLDTGALNNDNFDLFYTLFQNKYRTDIVKKIDYKLKTLDLNNFPVQSDKKIYSKFILAGHRGVGKSTELLRVSKLCRGYETVFVDAEAASGQESTEYTNLLVLIAEQIMRFGGSVYWGYEFHDQQTSSKDGR